MRLLSIILIAITFSSCKQDEINLANPRDWGYAGLVENTYVIYHVKEINYTISTTAIIEYDSITGEEEVIYTGGIDTSYYYIKEVVSEKMLDLEDDTIYVLHRFYADDIDGFDNTPDSVWTAKLTFNQYIRTENNRKYIKLVFPVSKEKIWDTNVKNELDNDEVSYTSIRVSDTINDFIFNDVVNIEHENQQDDFSGYDVRFEKYANNIGLIYKYSEFLEPKTKENSEEVLEPFRIGYGKIVEQKIIEYSK